MAIQQQAQPAEQTEQTEQMQLKRHLFSIEEYERMIEAAIFPEDEHLELIRGEIIVMAPIGLRHAACVARLTMLFARKVGDSAIVWVQNPIQLAGNSEPEPDLALLQPRSDFYSGHRPTPDDILLLVEVADTSAGYDRTIKVQIYATARIPEVWLVLLGQDVIEVHSAPAEGTYRNVRKAKRGETLSLRGGLTGGVDVNDILGPPTAATGEHGTDPLPN
jgi:Uma2 family endonuclease